MFCVHPRVVGRASAATVRSLKSRFVIYNYKVREACSWHIHKKNEIIDTYVNIYTLLTSTVKPLYSGHGYHWGLKFCPL